MHGWLGTARPSFGTARRVIRSAPQLASSVLRIDSDRGGGVRILHTQSASAPTVSDSQANNTRPRKCHPILAGRLMKRGPS